MHYSSLIQCSVLWCTKLGHYSRHLHPMWKCWFVTQLCLWSSFLLTAVKAMDDNSTIWNPTATQLQASVLPQPWLLQYAFGKWTYGLKVNQSLSLSISLFSLSPFPFLCLLLCLLTNINKVIKREPLAQKHVRCLTRQQESMLDTEFHEPERGPHDTSQEALAMRKDDLVKWQMHILSLAGVFRVQHLYLRLCSEGRLSLPHLEGGSICWPLMDQVLF